MPNYYKYVKTPNVRKKSPQNLCTLHKSLVFYTILKKSGKINAKIKQNIT